MTYRQVQIYKTYLDSLQMKTAKNWALLKVFIPPQLSPIDALLSQYRLLLFIHMRTCMFVDCSAYRISIWWNDILPLQSCYEIITFIMWILNNIVLRLICSSQYVRKAPKTNTSKATVYVAKSIFLLEFI